MLTFDFGSHFAAIDISERGNGPFWVSVFNSIYGQLKSCADAVQFYAITGVNALQGYGVRKELDLLLERMQ